MIKLSDATQMEIIQNLQFNILQNIKITFPCNKAVLVLSASKLVQKLHIFLTTMFRKTKNELKLEMRRNTSDNGFLDYIVDKLVNTIMERISVIVDLKINSGLGKK